MVYVEWSTLFTQVMRIVIIFVVLKCAMALDSLNCADVPLRIYSLTHSLCRRQWRHWTRNSTGVGSTRR